ncbi:MAG TPA: hypothetical protein VHP81_06435 [Lachnospiraceae bacterium]|nr:hypothetical protein [Lachnospiraceae bacterium]
MEQYDIRNQIKAENNSKLIGELGLIFFLIVIILCIIFVGKMPNPFKMVTPSNEKELYEAYDSGLDYIKISNATLEFTGYYKEDAKGNIIYNCYSTNVGKERFFVFVPAKNSGEDAWNPEETLKNYSFKAKMHTDNALFETVANDYDLSVEDFISSNVISKIMLDEARSDQARMYLIWIAFGIILLLCIIYTIISYVHLKSITARKEVRVLKKYGDIDEVLNKINDEIQDKLEFSSLHLKITQNYIAAFCNGKIFISSREDISEVRLKSKIRKAYGIVKLGYEDFIQFIRKNDTIFELEVSNELEAGEILEILGQRIEKDIEMT